MENKEKVGSPSSSSSSSSSSFTNDLFGAKESGKPPASSGIFSTIFPPPSTVLGMNSASELVGSPLRQSAGSQVWNKGTTGDGSKNREASGYNTSNKERSSIFQERAEPCPLSSSLYYGGQEDMYMRSSNPQTLGSYTDFKKDGEDDDQNGNNSHSASRGNWWQGSLYY